MKVMICYPPVYKEGKIPLLGQNRQFRYSSSHEVRIYPIVPSTAATLINQSGFPVRYIDGINERLTWSQFKEEVQRFKPDVMAIETKAPIVKLHWTIISELKEEFPETKFALMGDHVTYDPKESLENSKVDYVLTGGDYDISLLGLVKNLENNKCPLPTGVWHHTDGEIKNTGHFELIPNLDTLPFIDRELTKWWMYGEAYLHHPCTYMMWGRGCYPGRCSFCVWASNLWTCQPRLRSVKNTLDELEQLVNKLHVKEVFDDTDTSTWNKKWFHQLCQGIIERKLNEQVYISCNSRADNLDIATCELMKKANFRLLKVGLESGNEETLKRINKEETIEEIKQGVKNAKDAGLNILLTIMVGYPWEREEDVQKTLAVAKELMLYKTKVGDSLQASVITPYPGTPLYFEAVENGWFQINPKENDNFDMGAPTLKSPIPAHRVMELCDELWKIHLNPKFILKTLFSIRSFDHLRIMWRGMRSVTGHTKDF